MAEPLLGAPFKQGVRQQLAVRSKKRASQNLTDRDLAVQHGSTGWARISSGVVVEGAPELAKNNILQGGILSKLNTGFDQSGENSTYLKDAAQGFKPIPGVDSIEIVSQNAQGTIRKTDVAFKVHSLEQLETFERLYLRPGFSILLEFGHSAYYDNDENIISDVPSLVDFFGSADSETVVKRIIELQESSDYNYDAIFGVIMNFQYSYNMEGGYDCTFYIISKGSLLESILAISSGNTKNSDKKDDSAVGTATTFLEGLSNKKSESSKEDSKSEVLRIFNTIYALTGIQDNLLETLKKEFSSLNFTQSDTPYYLHDVSTDLTNSAKKVYITFSTLLKILNNTINYIVDKKTEFVRFGFNDEFAINSTFLTYDNHFSSNPHTCILKKQPADKQLFMGAGAKDFPNLSGDGDQIYTDILLDVSFLGNTLNNLADKDKSSHTVVDFLKEVFKKTSIALGSVNQFDFHYIDTPIEDKPIPTVYIVDRKITPTSKQLRSNILPCYGKGGLLSNISVTSKISNELSSLMALGAQGDSANLSNYAGLVLTFNNGLEDKFKKEIVENINNTKSTKDNSDDEDYKEKLSNIKKAVEVFVGGRTFKNSEGVSLEEPHKFITNYDIQRASNPIRGTLPFEVSFTMQGIGGLVIGQGFKLQEGILPGHVQRIAGFIVKSINHTIQGNTWTTDISAYMTMSEPDPEKLVKIFEPVELTQKIQDKVENFTDKSAV